MRGSCYGRALCTCKNCIPENQDYENKRQGNAVMRSDLVPDHLASTRYDHLWRVKGEDRFDMDSKVVGTSYCGGMSEKDHPSEVLIMGGVAKNNTTIHESKRRAAERWLATAADGIKNVAVVWLGNHDGTYDVLLKCYPHEVHTDQTTH